MRVRVRVAVRRHVRAVRAGVDAEHRARALAQHLHAEVEQRDLVERAVLLLGVRVRVRVRVRTLTLTPNPNPNP